jgi:hypothetical protein
VNPDPLADLAEPIADALMEVADELALLRDAFPRPRPATTPLETGEPGWPSAPGTLAQGFLGSRWNRRDGNVYATPATVTRRTRQFPRNPTKPSWTP